MDAISTLVVEGKVAHPMDLLSCRFTKNGEEILTGSADGILRKINYSDLTMSRLYFDEQMENAASPITSIKFSPFSTFCLATYAEGFIKYWNLSTGECVQTIQEENQILGFDVSPIARMFATAADTSKLSIYDLETGEIKRNLESSYRPEYADGHKSRVFSAKFHPLNAQELLSGGWDNTVQFWDLRRPSAVRHITGPHICGDSIDIDETGKKVLTCSFQDDSNLCLWDYNTTNLIEDFTLDKSKYYCGSFMGKRYVITAGSSPSILKIIDMGSYSIVASYTTPLQGLYAMDFSEIKSAKKLMGVKVVTIAAHLLVKMKFLYRNEADFKVTTKI